MKAMLSQPMAGKSEEEIVATRNRAIAKLEIQGYEIVNTLFMNDSITISYIKWYSKEAMEARNP